MHAFVVPIRDGRRGAARRPDRGRRPEDGAQRRRQRPDLVRRRAGAARARCSTGSPTCTEDGTYVSDDREPEPPLLHDARHPGPGPGLRRRRRHQRRQGRAGDRDPLRASAPAVRGDRREDEEELLLDYGQHQRRLFPLLARTYALHFAQEVVAGQCHEVFSRRRCDDEQVRRELESRAAGTKALGTWHATRTIQECREACGGAGYLSVNRFAALKADTDVFTTFEGDNTVLLQLVAKGLLTDYASELRGPRPARHGPVRRRARGRDRDREDQRAQAVERVRDLLPGGDEWDQEAGLLDPTTSWRCCGSARSTCWPASPAGSSAASTTG